MGDGGEGIGALMGRSELTSKLPTSSTPTCMMPQITTLPSLSARGGWMAGEASQAAGHRHR